MNAPALKLKERVKELKCLYDISKIAQNKDTSIGILMTKALSILPKAMQFPALAEVCITEGKTSYATNEFVIWLRIMRNPHRIKVSIVFHAFVNESINIHICYLSCREMHISRVITITRWS